MSIVKRMIEEVLLIFSEILFEMPCEELMPELLIVAGEELRSDSLA